MRSEEEKILEELAQIRIQNAVIMDIRFSQYVLTPEFKNQFRSLPKKVCKECGKDFRVTHRCGDQFQQIWIPNWENIIRKNFDSTQPKPLKKQEKTHQVTKNQKEHLPSLQEIPILPIKNTKQQLKKEQVPQKGALSKQPSKYTQYTSPISEAQNTKPKPPPIQGFQGKKLSITSIAQLTQKERIVYEQLKNWRSTRSYRENIKPFMIAVDTVLMAIVLYRVSNTSELLQISGITPYIAQKYGTDILRIMIRNGMATGIKTHQAQRKPSGLQKVISNVPSNNKKAFIGIVCCIFIVIIIVILASL